MKLYLHRLPMFSTNNTNILYYYSIFSKSIIIKRKFNYTNIIIIVADLVYH